MCFKGAKGKGLGKMAKEMGECKMKKGVHRDAF